MLEWIAVNMGRILLWPFFENEAQFRRLKRDNTGLFEANQKNPWSPRKAPFNQKIRVLGHNKDIKAWQKYRVLAESCLNGAHHF
jgi:hypothetical protein